MNKNIRSFIGLLLFTLFLLAGCTINEAPASSPVERDTLFQLSTLSSLMAGNYDGIENAAKIAGKGDFGIGTFEGLDGEMVMLDGNLYQVKDTGEVVMPDDTIEFPFLAMTYFDEDASSAVSGIKNYDALKETLDQMIIKKDRFYAIKISGEFSKIKVRSVPKQQKPYPVLSEVTKNQPEFNYENIDGTLVGFWCPDYVGSVNVPGYHLHFISNDHASGGHLLEIEVTSATIFMDETMNFEMELGEIAAAGAGIEDIQKEIEQVEK